VGAVAALLLCAAAVTAETYTIDRTHSSVQFRIRHLVGRTTGEFGDFAGTIVYDPAQPEASRVEATLQAASINTANAQRDTHLKSPDFLNVAQYPTITFVSSKVTRQGDGLAVAGNLTLHGVTRGIVLPVQVLGLGTHPMPQMNGAPVAGFAASTTIRRADFGVNSWTDAAGVLGDEVEITLNIEALGPVPSK
jgi:polyisoprenoid-binding protein YceI